MATQITEAFLRDYAARDGLALGQLVRDREVSPTELVEAAITLIERLNPQLNAVIHKVYDYARHEAAGPVGTGAFAGVPFLLKELATQWAGMPLTNASRYLKDQVAPADMEVVTRIKRAGFILVGKSNAPENGWSISTEPVLYGRTHNPWRSDVTPGGSSGGAGSAVAARLVPVAEASDGAGSIRVPAANCGLVGLKPSRGRVTLGPVFVDYWYGGAYLFCVSRTVRDTAAYLDAVAGAMAGDPYTPPASDDPWLERAARAPGPLRIAFTTRPPDGSPIHDEAVAAVRSMAALLDGMGHQVEEHDLAFDAATAWRVYTNMAAVQTAGMFEALAPFVGRPVTPQDVEPLTWAVIERGRSIGGTRHAAEIEQVRALGRGLVQELLPYDVLLTPTLTQPPRPFGYFDMTMTDYDAYNARWTDSVFLFPFNLSGLPALSLPTHWTADGLPMGTQFVGRYGDEATLLQLATQIEAAQPWIGRKPPVSA